MKKNLTLLLLSFMSILTFNACDNNDDDKSMHFRDYDNKKTAEYLVSSRFISENTGSVFIIDGNGNYTFKSSNQEVIEDSSIKTVYFEAAKKDVIFFIPLTVGETVITVTDGSGNTATLKIIVTDYVDKYFVHETELIVNDDIDATIKAEIEADMRENNLQANNTFFLAYRGVDDGELTIYNDAEAKDKRFEGTFLFEDENPGRYTINLTYNGQTHKYKGPFSKKQLDTKASEVSKLSFREDMTEHYKAKYPTENITEVSFIVSLSTIK